MPWHVVMLYLALLCIGLSSIARCDEWLDTDKVSQQGKWAVLSGILLILTTLPSYRIFCRWSYLLFALALTLLLLVFLNPSTNGAHRWIRLGSISMQPSEFVKLAYILALARYLIYRNNYRRLTGLIIPFILTLIPTALILKEPDLGTALIFLPVLFTMMFAAGAKLRHLAIIGVAILMVCPIAWPHLNNEQRSRITSWANQVDGGDQPRNHGYQLHQSKMMLSMGGLWGSWWTGNSTDDPKAYRLPEARTDFIFSVIGERWGVIGASSTLLLFIILIWSGLNIAITTQESFGRLIAVGIVTTLSTQVIINTGMTVGLVPITGLTLPLVSYGGSSLVASGIAVGLLCSIRIRPGYEIVGEPFRFPR